MNRCMACGKVATHEVRHRWSEWAQWIHGWFCEKHALRVAELCGKDVRCEVEVTAA